jgi:hypothetical protein
MCDSSPTAEAEACFRKRDRDSENPVVEVVGAACNRKRRPAPERYQSPLEARSMLAEIYNWSTEGFDTANLKDAKELLDELGAWCRDGARFD